MPEITTVEAIQEASRGREAPIRISLAVKTQGQDSQMGIGIHAMNGNSKILAQWALRNIVRGIVCWTL